MKSLADTLRSLVRLLSDVLVFLLLLPVHFYRRFISPFTPPSCRYSPSCSQYAIEALRKHGPFKGLWLATYRILRCAPWGGWGYDPVPDKFSFFYYRKISPRNKANTDGKEASSVEKGKIFLKKEKNFLKKEKSDVDKEYADARKEDVDARKEYVDAGKEWPLRQGTPVTDVHAHALPPKAGSAIVSLDPREFLTISPEEKEKNLFSVGIHPWHIQGDGSEQLSLLRSILEGDDTARIVMLGEMGLDKIQGAPADVQRSVFISQLQMAACFGLVPVIHDVRSMQEILHIRRSLHLTGPWLIHGFRGKPEQAGQYLRAGCHLALGTHYRKETLLALPAEEIFLESDNNPAALAPLYEQAAADLGTTVGSLEELVGSNIERLLRNKFVHT